MGEVKCGTEIRKKQGFGFEVNETKINPSDKSNFSTTEPRKIISTLFLPLLNSGCFFCSPPPQAPVVGDVLLSHRPTQGS